MKRQLVIATAAVALLAGCGGGAAADSQGAADVADQLGCPNAKVQTKLQGNEPDRDERAQCHGLTIVTFDDANQRDAYVTVVSAVNKMFEGESATLSGDGWAVMGSKSKVQDAQDKLGGTIKK